MTLGDRKGSEGGVVVQVCPRQICGSHALLTRRLHQSVQAGGNAAKAGLKAGDTVLYTSSFFGDELWPADKLAFTKTAINAKQNDVDFVVLRGKAGDEINVKRLKARPSPPRFGRKLTAAQKERATHICLDCGYIYFLPTSFDDQPKAYECPQCLAPKSRFAEYDAVTGKTKGSNAAPAIVTTIGVIGLVGTVALVIGGLSI